MKNFTSLISSIVCVCALTIFGVGCGGQVEESSRTETMTPATVGTLAFETKDPQTGVVRGTYEYQGHRIKFEVIRGEKTPLEALLIYPGVTSHSIDVRVCDDHDYCFINGAGGHTLADQSWIQENQNDVPTGDRGLKNFQTAWELRNDLGKQPLGAFDGLEEEIQSLKDATNQPPDTWQGIPPEYDPLHKKPQSSIEGTPAKGVLSLVGIAPYTHIFKVWRQSLAGAFAYHSSTHTTVLDARGLPINLYYTCNHGTCGNSTQMSLYCSRNFSGRSSSNIPIRVRCEAPAKNGAEHAITDTGCCMSPYGYAPLYISHVCNDDSRLQRDMTIAGKAVIASYCYDLYLQGQAPYCW